MLYCQGLTWTAVAARVSGYMVQKSMLMKCRLSILKRLTPSVPSQPIKKLDKHDMLSLAEFLCSKNTEELHKHEARLDGYVKVSCSLLFVFLVLLCCLFWVWATALWLSTLRRRHLIGTAQDQIPSKPIKNYAC